MKELVWYDKLQYIAMLLMAAAMPVDFHLGLWASVSLIGTSVIKIIAQRRIGNRSLSILSKVAFIALVLYWIIHLVSVGYGGDVAVGMQVVWLKAVLLIFALCFLLTDTSYLQEKHFRWLFYALWASVCGVFLYYVGVGVGKLVDGNSMAAVCGMGFDPRHHAYTALYVNTALAFVYVELSSKWNRLLRWLRAVLIISIPLLVMYIMMINSRAGVLVMWMVAAICVLHLSFFMHKWKAAIIVALLFVGYTISFSKILPGHTDRIASTIEVVSKSVKDNTEPTDVRVAINKSALAVAMENPIVGYGAGQYRAVLSNQYDLDNRSVQECNAHNQYVETVLAVGIIGLMLLLAFLLIPLWQALKGKRYVLSVVLFTAIVCVNLLFESMLERQMGLLFIGFFMSVMILMVNHKKSTSSTMVIRNEGLE